MAVRDSTVERRSLRIEMLLPSMAIAGMEMLVARMTRRLIDRGHIVGITCIEELGTLGEHLRSEGIRVQVIPTPGLRTILEAPDLERALLQAAPDVVHAHNGAWIKGAGAARRLGLPIIATVHGFTSPIALHDRVLQHWAARRSDAIVAVSEAVRATLGRRFHIPMERCTVILNGVNTDGFGPSIPTGSLRQLIGVTEHVPIVGHVARLDSVKNPLLLVDAFAMALVQTPAARLVIVGDGPMRSLIEKRIAQLGIDRSVHLLGLASDVARLYRDMDVFALSSLTEGTSVSMLEAMSSGVACVATAVGGNIELLERGACGVLTDPMSADSLAAGISSLLTDRNRRESLAIAGRHRVATSYSEQRMLDEYEATYNRLIRPASSGTHRTSRQSATPQITCAE